MVEDIAGACRDWVGLSWDSDLLHRTEIQSELMVDADRRRFADRPAARVIALIVFLTCAASLTYLHRNDLWPAPATTGDIAADDPAGPCIEQRFADIDRMVTEAVIDQEQAVIFKQRAEAMCRATEGGNNPPALPLPGLTVE